ncbi:putative multidrug resistance-associated protein [Aspergillus unguis]
MASVCPVNSDNQAQIRVSVNCRPLDFTLLFEQAVFSILPSAVFLLWLLPRLEILRRLPVKSGSLQLAISKLVLLSVLLVLRIVLTVYQLQNAALHTRLSIPTAVLDLSTTLGAIILSFLEDQRTVQPSDALIVYFSALSILYIPLLRTLWLIPAISVSRGLFTTIYIVIILITLLESAQKVKFVQPRYYNVPVETVHGFWGRNLLFWVFPLFRNGYSHVICLDDLPDVDGTLLGDSAEARLAKTWTNSDGKYRLIKATSRAFYRPLLSAVLPRVLMAGFTFCQPFLLSATINWMSAPTTAESRRYGQALVGAYALVYTGIAVSTAIYYRQASRLATTVRSGLIAMIHEQTLALRSTAGLKSAEAVALMGTDTTRIMSSIRLLHEMWASLLSVGVAIWLLEIQVYVACVVPAVIAVACIIATTPLSTRCAGAQKKWVEQVQKRIAVTTAMLGDMKAVKMLGLEGPLSESITRYRKVELAASRRFRKLIVGIVMLSSIPLDLAPFAVFVVYTIIAAVKHDSQILTNQAFTTLSLISILTSPLMTFIQSLPQVTQSIGCFDRIQEYCLRERSNESLSSLDEKPTRDGFKLTKLSVAAKGVDTSKFVSFENASVSWTPDSPAVLHDLTLSIPTGKITMIVGPVGCGKSALLETIMGQTQVLRGTMHPMPANVAYCPQSPWITNSTIRDNITGGSPLDQKWYDLTVSACALVEDLSQFTLGSMYMAGSGGVALSGGQKQRVALARAVYSRLPVLVLDDTFSGVDSRNTRIIGEQLFGRDGLVRRSNTTVVLATHNRFFLPYADTIILLESGRKALHCTYPELINQRPEYIHSDGHHNAVNPVDEQTSTQEIKLPSKKTITEKSPSTTAIDNLTRRDGSWSIYSYYARKAGLKRVGLFAACFLAYGFTTQFTTIWLDWWSSANETQPSSDLGKWLGVYTTIVLLAILSLGAGCWLLIVDIVGNTSLGLHSDLLGSVLRAPFSFFQQTDSGSIVNRFSQDMELIDFALPVTALNFVEGKLHSFIEDYILTSLSSAFSICIVSLVILCVIGKYITLALPFTLFALWALQRSYLRTSRQVRLLDIEANAPLFSHFQETVAGLSVIQSLHWQPQRHEQCIAKLNNSQKPFYMMFCIRQSLKLALDLLVMALAVVLVAIVTTLKDRFSAGEIGVSLTLMISISQNLNTAIEAWTQMEISLAAVARVQEFVAETPAEGEGAAAAAAAATAGWLTHGEIRCYNVTAGYSLHNPPILTNLTLHIPPKHKIAVCGSSGSGKTSFIMALLRMLDVSQGQITIDGVNIATIPPAALRAQITVIPQDPFFPPGTLRESFDPRRTLSETQIGTAIQKVGLWEAIRAKGGLDVAFDAMDWSYGEKQLLTLARALSAPRPLLILDEATSGVDWETEARMLEIIEQECAAQTVIAVVHRLRHIEHFDRVALLQQGALVEYDAPSVLLGRDSEFRKLYTAAR